MSARHVAGTGPSLPVWDPLVRVVHWTLVGCVAVAWLTADDGQSAHKIVGYIALAGIVVRLIWGKLGSHYARFSQFVRRPAVVIGYLRQSLAGTSPRYIGHNPLGGWMIIALLLSLALIGFTGHLLTTEIFWGDELMEELHEGIASFMLLLIAAHVGGVIYASRQHRENLARAMITGHKPAAQNGDIA